jgi:hypothetical protein
VSLLLDAQQWSVAVLCRQTDAARRPSLVFCVRFFCRLAFTRRATVLCEWLGRRLTEWSEQDNSCSPRWFSVRWRFRVFAASI